MTDATAIQASYSDFRLVKTRSTAQIVLELPIEEAERFLQIFGVPLPGKERHVAIALLRAPDNTIATGATPNPSEREPTKAANDATRSSQAESAGGLGERSASVGGNTEQTGASERSQQAKERYRNASDMQRAAMRASILCGEHQYQTWIGVTRIGLARLDSEEAAKITRQRIGANSRSEIGTDYAVYERYIALETQYLQDTGKMAEARQ